MEINVKGCEFTNEGNIKIRRDLFKEEPKVNTMVKWLASGFTYKGMVYHKNVKHIFIKIWG